MKKFVLCLLILLIFNGCTVNQNQSNVNNETKANDSNVDNNINLTASETPLINTEIPKHINVEDNDLLSNLAELCKSPRRFDTDGENRASIFIIDKMKEYGFQTNQQEFYVYLKTGADIDPPSAWHYFYKYSGNKDSVGKGTNIIATTVNPDKKKTLYITAHYDTGRETNGIRDNGSGVVVAMEIAKQLQGINLPINIEFVFFSAEEAGMQGSCSFVSQLTQEEKANALGCINIDVVGEKGDHEVLLKTYYNQINVLSLLIDEFHEFSHASSEKSDHISFYMGEIPAIYFADENVKTKDTTNSLLDELDIKKLKGLTKIICDFIMSLDLQDYDNLLKNSYIKEYTDLPDTEEVNGYSLVQVNSILKDNGAGSDTQYILKNDSENKIVIIDKDSRFLSEKLASELQTFDIYNEHVKYKVSEGDNNIIVQYVDEWIGYKYNILEGNISADEALALLNDQSRFTNYGRLLSDLD